MKFLGAIMAAQLLALAACAANLPPIQTVFVILLENHNWSLIAGNPDAPFINGTLLPQASHCEQYYNPPGVHPSEPNYLWLEAGTNFSIFNDEDPASNHQDTTNHLVALLERAGISWKTYQEDIMAGYVPLVNTNNYAVRHNPFAFFDDVTGTNDPGNAYGIAHIRPYEELAADLTNLTVARYNFITPDLNHSGHNAVPPDYNTVRQTDDWLASEVPKIMNSAAYSNNGALFITWDEAEGGGDGPIGMMVLSPLARGGGYFNDLYYTHSSFVRTMQEIFGVMPLLGDAANATDLSDLFTPFAISVRGFMPDGTIELSVTGVQPGQTNFVQSSTDFWNWQTIQTNIAVSNSFTATDHATTSHAAVFYRAGKTQ